MSKQEDIAYEIMPPVGWANLLPMIDDVFIPEEPLHYNFGITYEMFDKMMVGGTERTIKDNIAIVARKGLGGEILGAKLFHMLSRGEKHPGWGDAKAINENTSNFQYFMNSLESGYDIFEKYPSAKKVYIHLVLAVQDEHRGRGIGARLVKLSDEMAARNSCEYGKVIVTNIASYKIFSKLGYKKVCEHRYDTFEKDGKKMFDMKKMGNSKFAAIMVKKL